MEPGLLLFVQLVENLTYASLTVLIKLGTCILNAVAEGENAGQQLNLTKLVPVVLNILFENDNDVIWFHEVCELKIENKSFMIMKQRDKHLPYHSFYFD